MKKIVCILLSLIMVFSVTANSAAVSENGTDTPIIIIPGFLQTALFLEKENGKKEQVWLPDLMKGLPIIEKNLPEVLTSLFGVFLDNPEAFGKSLMKTMSDLMPMMKCNPDGTSVYPVTHYENDPAKRNLSAIKKNKDIKMQAYYTFAEYICENEYADFHNVFFFEYDGRMDVISISEELRQFIKDVKDYTKKDKVRLFGVSYGGQIAEAYLHFYMNDFDVEKAVFNVPSWKGTNFADRILRGTVEVAFDDIMDIVESISCSDTEFNKLLKDVDMTCISRILNGISEGIAEYAKHWSSVYSLTDEENYEALKETFLEPTESAEIIRRNDIVHYEIMPNIKETLEKCIASGIDIAIQASSGIELSMGGTKNSDLLLAVEDVTGARAAVMGERFKNGYRGAKTTCSNDGHYHISPSMEIDASTAFLPENTWFLDGSHHAMFQYERYGAELNAKLLCTDKLKDIYSSSEFPQFMSSTNPHRGIYAEFDSSTSGYVTIADTKLIIENLYKSNKVKILSVTADGMDIKFDLKKPITLKPGEKAEIAFTGTLPEKGIERAALTVNYLKIDTVTTANERTFDFTVFSEAETDADGSFIENEYYTGDASGISFFKKIIYFFIYLKDILFVLVRYLSSDAFKYLL